MIFASVAVAEAQLPVTLAGLQKALGKYQEMESLEVDFHQIKSLKDVQIQLESSGHLSVSESNRIEWKVFKPEPLKVVLENNTISVGLNGKSETFHAGDGPSGKDREGMNDLLNWLKLDAQAIMKSYDVTRLKTSTYRFVSKKKQSTLISLNMQLSNAGYVSKLTFYEASGDEIEITFAQPKIKSLRKQ